MDSVPLIGRWFLKDPNGHRILYDAGRTVAGAEDPRLGDIDVVLLSHVHGDHLGDRRIATVNQGTCAQPQADVSTVPNSNTVEIAVGQQAQMVVGSEMSSFLANKVEGLGGDPGAVQLVRFGASYEIDGVKFTTVPVRCEAARGDRSVCQGTELGAKATDFSGGDRLPPTRRQQLSHGGPNPPGNSAGYCHRTGRCARAVSTGNDAR